MERRRIGSLEVSAVGLGCNYLGTLGCDPELGVELVHEALDAGVTYFDTADEYGQNYADPADPGGWGASEEIIGRAVVGRRSDVVIATKFGASPHLRPEFGGAGPRWARQALEDSLQRLGTDYIDLYQVHFPDPDIPLGETMAVLAEFVAAGKVREIGCCNFTADMLREAASIAADLGLPGFVSNQGPLNLFQRAALDEVIPACEQVGFRYIPYYPLASGMLTGKYRRDGPIRSDTRLTDGRLITEGARQKLFSERTFIRLDALECYAQDHGHTLLELAIGWLLAIPAVPSVIAGAAKRGQVTMNATSSRWILSQDEVTEVLQIVNA